MADLSDPQPSSWTEASQGIYGLTLDELRLLIFTVHEFYQQRGSFPTATELRVALRRPGL